MTGGVFLDVEVINAIGDNNSVLSEAAAATSDEWLVLACRIQPHRRVKYDLCSPVEYNHIEELNADMRVCGFYQWSAKAFVHVPHN